MPAKPKDPIKIYWRAINNGASERMARQAVGKAHNVVFSAWSNLLQRYLRAEARPNPLPDELKQYL